jgi:ankyrin repeat protein
MEYDSSSARELRLASQKGLIKAVKYLTEEKRLNPLQEDENGRNAIYCAAWRGQLAVLKYFIEEQGHNPASASSTGKQAGWTPLHVAAQFNHLELVRYLVAEQQVDPMCETEGGSTPLYLACQHDNNMDVVVYLVNAMSQHLPLKDVVSCRSKDGQTPLHTAALKGQLKIIKYLITEVNCDPSIVIPDEHHGRTTKCGGRIALHYAAQKGHLHVMKFLIEDQHCDPSHYDCKKTTPLHLTAQFGHKTAVEYLTLEQHCDPLCTDIMNDTPLHNAALFGHLEVVKFMIETLHCPPDVRGQQNATPLEQARSRGHHHVVEYFESIMS